MSATVSVELYSPEDKEAFAAFLTASASADRARPKTDSYGGISKALNTLWRNAGSGEGQTDETTSTSEVSLLSPETQATAAPQRERGKPSAGSARRTKAEIAEDEAADVADAAAKTAGEETGAVVADRQISTAPEDRKDTAQDAADEAAETAAAKAASGKALTHDDFRMVMGEYVQRFGMEFAQAEGKQIIGMMFGADKTKTSDIPDNQKALANAVSTVKSIMDLRAANPDFKDFEEILDLFKKQAGF